MTERKKLERDLLQANKLSSMGTLVSGIAHELNTPLATILGFSEELLKEDVLSPDSRKYANWILKESKRCTATVQQLLKFSHRYEPKTITFDLNEVLATVLPLYRYQLQADSIELKIDLQQTQLPVFGDPERTQEAILNILENAHQAIKRHDTCGLICVKTEQNASEARIEISNNGPKIPPENLKKIFDPFFSTKKVGSGTGLGLSLSCGIIQEHHGRIQAENLKEGGVRFLISIPLANAAQTESKEEALECELPEGLKILIVEDDARFSAWLALFLGQQAASVITAENGLDAIEHLKARAVDLIISDLKMPKMNEIALCQWIEAHRPEDLKRFVLLTGVGDRDFNGFCQTRDIPILLKPVEKADLLQCLCAVLEGIHA